jgi:hypothetical protein
MPLIQLGQDINGDAFPDYNGYSISLNGNGSIVAIGSPYNCGTDGNVRFIGRVRIYELSDITWIQRGQDINGEAADDLNGISVSLSADGSTVAIGASDNDINGNNSGYVRVYKFNGTDWVKQGLNILGENADDHSGFSVNLSADGSTVAIGSYLNDNNGIDSGHVRIYELSGNTWVQKGQNISGDASGDQSGWSVSLSANGSIVAIGSTLNDGNTDISDDNRGLVRVYELLGTTWVQKGQDINGESTGDNTGGSVSLSADGSIIAIGAAGNDANGTNSGHVRIYELSGNTWIQKGEDIDGEAENDGSGSSISLSADGSIIVIGSPYSSINASYSGHVRIYKFNGTAWVKQGLTIYGSSANIYSGYSVSLSSDGSIVAIGSPLNDSNGITDNGCVRVYRLTTDPTVAGPNLRPVSILLPIQVDFNQFGDITVRVEGEDVSYNYDLRLHYYSKPADTTAVDLCNNVFKYNESTVSDALTDVSCSAPATLKALIKTALDASDISCAVPRKVYNLSGDMALNPLTDNSSGLLTTRPALMKDYLRGWLYTHLYDIIGLAATTGSIDLDMSGFSEYISESLKTQLCDNGANGAAVREFIFKAMFVQDPARFQNASGSSTAPDFSGQTLANKDLLRGMPFKAGDSLSFLIKFNFPKGNIKAPVQSTVLRLGTTTTGITVGEQTNITVSTKSLSNTIAPGDLFRDFRQCLVWLQVHIEY